MAVVTRRAKQRRNSCSARHYDQIRSGFRTAWARCRCHSHRPQRPQFDQVPPPIEKPVVSHVGVIPRRRWWQNPRLVDQFSQINLATMCPLRVLAGCDYERIVEQKLHIQVVQWNVSGDRRPQPCQNQVDLALAQRGRRCCRRRQIIHPHHDARIFLVEPLHQPRQEECCKTGADR